MLSGVYGPNKAGESSFLGGVSGLVEILMWLDLLLKNERLEAKSET